MLLSVVVCCSSCCHCCQLLSFAISAVLPVVVAVGCCHLLSSVRLLSSAIGCCWLFSVGCCCQLLSAVLVSADFLHMLLLLLILLSLDVVFVAIVIVCCCTCYGWLLLLFLCCCILHGIIFYIPLTIFKGLNNISLHPSKKQINKMFYINGFQQYKDRYKCKKFYNDMMNCNKNIHFMNDNNNFCKNVFKAKTFLFYINI